MANCARELRDAIPPVTDCPDDNEVVMFITPTGYVGRLWSKLIECITAAVLLLISAPDDEEVKIDPSWAGRNYYDLPALAGKRYRLYREGILLNSEQWRPIDTGGWQLLKLNDKLYLNQIFTISYY